MATIKDIVRDTGFGLGTVSRALNNSPGVKESTRRTILESAARLGFTPSPAARALGGKQERKLAVGLVIPHLIDPFFTEITRGVYTALRGRDVRLSLHVVFDDEGKEEELDRVLEEGHENALIIVSTELTPEQEKRITDRGTRAVLVDTPHERLPFIAVDNRTGGRMAADAVAALDFRSVAWVGDAYRSRQAVEREEGFTGRLEALGITARVEHAHITPEGLDPAFGRLFSELLTPAAVAFHSDLMVYRALEHCRRIGLVPGRDVHLLGYDDLPQSALLGISSIAQPMREMGTLAAERILDRDADPGGTWLEPVLRLRATTGDPR